MREEKSAVLFPACIQCGLCLEACPTYQLSMIEGDCARGRIIICRSLSEPNGLTEDQVVTSLDQCLLCGSCQAACPSGVNYIHGIDAVRAGWADSWLNRYPQLLRFLMAHVFPRPRLLNHLLHLIRASIKSGLASLIVTLFFKSTYRPHFRRMIESIKVSKNKRPKRKRVARTKDDSDSEVAIFRGCVTPVIFPQVIEAWFSILDHQEITFEIPGNQGCCGALNQHHGDLEQAREMARQNIDAFAGTSGAILVEAAGCGATLQSYSDLLKDDPLYAAKAADFSARVKDAAQYLVARQSSYQGLRATDNKPAESGVDQTRKEMKVVYQEPCHLRHLQKASRPTAELLARMPGTNLLSAPEVDLCCGSAGIYNLLEPAIAAELGDRKASLLSETGADMVVTSNPGCRIQLAGRLHQKGLSMRHVLEVIDSDLRNEDLDI